MRSTFGISPKSRSRTVALGGSSRIPLARARRALQHGLVPSQKDKETKEIGRCQASLPRHRPAVRQVTGELAPVVAVTSAQVGRPRLQRAAISPIRARKDGRTAHLWIELNELSKMTLKTSAFVVKRRRTDRFFPVDGEPGLACPGCHRRPVVRQETRIWEGKQRFL